MALSLLTWPVLVALLIVISAILLDLRKTVRKYCRYFKLLRAVPAPDDFYCLPLLGHIPYLYKQNEELLLKSMEETNKPENRDRYITKLWIGPFIATII